MKVLTIKQPWATLIAEGLKKYEFRTWNTKYRGSFLIHAGLGGDKKAMERVKHLNLSYPQGCIIAKVNLNDVIKVDDSNRDKIYHENELVYSNLKDDKSTLYAFKLTNVEKLEPIYTSGKLGFWNYNIMLAIIQKTLGIDECPEFLSKYLETPSVKRLKKIGYFCGMDYASKDIYDFPEYISRFDHSLNVALITWKYTHDKCATIAGLLHDISTPTFAHVIDYMNGDYSTQESTEKYTESIILGDKELIECLNSDGINPNDVIDFKKYSIVDLDRPSLCADRLDGIILPGLYWSKSIDISDACKIIDDVQVYKNEFGRDELGFKTKAIGLLAKKVSLEIDECCHSNYDNYMMDLLSNIVKRIIELKLIKYEDLYLLNEEELVNIISTSLDDTVKSMWKTFKIIKKKDIPHIDIGYIKVRDLNPIVNGERISR